VITRKKGCAISTSGAQTRGLKLMFVFLLATAVSSGIARTAKADTGISMLRYDCNPETQAVTIEPFILWNGDTKHGEADLEDPFLHPIQVYKTSTFYSMKSRFGDPLDHVCIMGDRRVDIFYQNQELTITDTSSGNQSRYHLNLGDRDITGGGWRGYGPTFWLESPAAHRWQICRGREGTVPAPTVCEDWSGDDD
jgi:hypothetical protein